MRPNGLLALQVPRHAALLPRGEDVHQPQVQKASRLQSLREEQDQVSNALRHEHEVTRRRYLRRRGVVPVRLRPRPVIPGRPGQRERAV